MTLISETKPRETLEGKATPRASSRGVYFLANDKIFDVAIAFLNSFRISNPTIPLCLIPFGDDVARLREVSKLYKFTIFDDIQYLKFCDSVALKFFHWPCGQFRKLCAFAGPFDEFIYIDCDTVVLRDVSFAFQYLSHFNFVFSHSDAPGLRRWVWRDTIRAADSSLSARQIAFSANTGFFCSRRGEIDRGAVQARLAAGVELAPHMELGCAEQPFLNYLVVTSGKRFTSLYTLSREAKHLNVPLELWAGNGYRRFGKDAVEHGREEIFLVHWAGLWSASPRDKKIYAFFEKIGLRSRTPTMKFFMPRKKLWKFYRHFPQSSVEFMLDLGHQLI